MEVPKITPAKVYDYVSSVSPERLELKDLARVWFYFFFSFFFDLTLQLL